MNINLDKKSMTIELDEGCITDNDKNLLINNLKKLLEVSSIYPTNILNILLKVMRFIPDKIWIKIEDHDESFICSIIDGKLFHMNLSTIFNGKLMQFIYNGQSLDFKINPAKDFVESSKKDDLEFMNSFYLNGINIINELSNCFENHIKTL